MDKIVTISSAAVALVGSITGGAFVAEDRFNQAPLIAMNVQHIEEAQKRSEERHKSLMQRVYEWRVQDYEEELAELEALPPEELSDYERRKIIRLKQKINKIEKRLEVHDG